MAEFMELLETIQAEEASRSRLFRGEGRGVRTIAGRDTPQYKGQLAEAARLIASVYEGRRPLRILMEAMTTSDFPLLFGDILDRQLLGKYEETPQHWSAVAKRATVRDFRTVSRFAVDGAETVLDTVEEQAEYPAAVLSETRYQYAVQKRGRRVPFSWEAMVNDDLDALKDVPERFARACRRSEDRFVTELYADANGPHASLYTSGNANIVTSNPALSTAALQTAFGVLGAQVDEGGDPIMVEMVSLVVPPALEVTARNILNAIHIDALTGGGGVSAQAIRAENWMRNRVQLVVNPYLPLVSSTADGDTAWYLFASPSVGRPALEMGFLRGFEQPQVFMKSPNASRVGGGSADPMDGDFDTDSIQYKVRHVFGGARISPIMTVASEGDGS